jgi:hypothetical protein
MNSTPQTRLVEFIELKFGSKAKFSRYMGDVQQSVFKYIGKGKSIYRDFDKLEKLKQLGLNLEWYYFGKGEMLAEENTKQETENTSIEQAYEIVLQSLDKLSFEQLLKLKRKSNELTKELMEL